MSSVVLVAVVALLLVSLAPPLVPSIALAVLFVVFQMPPTMMLVVWVVVVSVLSCVQRRPGVVFRRAHPTAPEQTWCCTFRAMRRPHGGPQGVTDGRWLGTAEGR